MGTRAVVETRHDRKALAADAGYGPFSLVSTLAGVVAAYGTFALLLGVTVGIMASVEADIDVTSNWQDLGTTAALVVAGLLLVSYLFGGYIAGRMARRSGPLHGAAVFLGGVLLAVGAAAAARALGAADAGIDHLRGLGVPTTSDEWGDLAALAGIASLAAMLVGSLAGGVLGDRWHSKLLTRALDPERGAEATARRQAQHAAAEAEERRVASFRRVRASSPTRTVRVDRDADTVATPVIANASDETEDDSHDHDHDRDDDHRHDNGHRGDALRRRFRKREQEPSRT